MLQTAIFPSRASPECPISRGVSLGRGDFFQFVALKMLAIKDFRWERIGGKTRSEAVFGRLGQGEVNWKEVFDTLKNSDFAGPISLHIEYTALGESTKTERERMLKIARQDLAFLRGSLEAAGMV